MRSPSDGDRCIAVEEFGDLAKRDAGDPRRAHVEECARCRAGYLNYLSFMGAAGDDANPTLSAARRPLDQLIERESRKLVAGTPRHGVTRLFRSWRFRGFVLVPAACAAVLIMYVATRPQNESSEEPLLRSMAPAASITLGETAIGADGSLRLAWLPAADATGYQVAVYAGSLRPVYQSPVGEGTETVIPPGALRSVDPGKTALLWRVTAYRGADVVARSPVGVIRPR
jgi:anti-sigma-K factor RskA